MNNQKKFINFPRRITSYEFYRQILPQLPNDEELENNEIDMVFDFTTLEKLNAEVLPKIIVLAESIYKKSGNKVYFNIPYNPDLLSDLHALGLFSVIKKSNAVHDGNWGGYDIKSKNDELLSNSFYFPFGTKMHQIEDSLVKLESTLNKLKLSDITIRYDEFVNNVCEVAYNGCFHSKSNCVLSIEPNFDRKVVAISISDSGIGLFNNVKNKIPEVSPQDSTLFKPPLDINKLPNIKNSDIGFRESFYSIIKSTCFRMFEREMTGLYQVMHYVTSTRGTDNYGTMRITTKDCQVIWTHALLTKFYPKPVEAPPRSKDYSQLEKSCVNCLNHLIRNYENEDLAPEYKNVRKLDKVLDGVHVEILIPL